MTPVLLGVIPGLALALALARILSSRVYGLSPAKPFILAGASLLLVMVALAACYFPARRATRVDPIVALRHQ